MLARLMYGLMASVALIHLHLFVFSTVPVHIVVLGLGLQAVYLGLIQQMPNIRLLAPLSLTAIGIFRLFVFKTLKPRSYLMLNQLAFTSKNYAGLFI
jgi:hypothetical protein